jgi:phosphoribosylglycinamide formyltransferase-1
MTSPPRQTVARLPIVVLISGNGSNLQAIIDAIENDRLHAEIRAVISNRSDAYGLERARKYAIPSAVINHRDYPDRDQFDRALQLCIDQYQPQLLVLAGFMRILTSTFVDHYQGRMLNIHPSLLPAYTGLNTHQQAIDAGAKEHGVSIHFVTSQLDGGPVISQARIPVLDNDTPVDLALRVQAQEHHLYPQTLEWFCQGRIRQQNNQVIFDGQPLAKPIDCTTHPD